jgi:hypothetical protein
LKKRERRRYLTHKYQQKQVRLANMYRSYRPYDSERYFLRPLAKKQRFLDRLRDNYVGPEWDDRWRESRTRWMIGMWATEFTPEELGRFRNHSYRDCGRTRCPSCGNPRRSGWHKRKDKLTLQEQRSEEAMKQDLRHYKEEKYRD